MVTIAPTTFVEKYSQEIGDTMDWSFALPVMFITLREGVEALLAGGIADFIGKSLITVKKKW